MKEKEESDKSSESDKSEEGNDSVKEVVVEESKKKEEGTETSEYSETDHSDESKEKKGGKKSDECEDTEVIVSIKKPSQMSVGSVKRKGAGGGGCGHLPRFYCGKRFSSSNSLRVHLEYVHLWQSSDSTSEETTNNEDLSST